MSFLTSSGFLIPGQYGFLAGTDTSSAAADLVTLLQDTLNNGRVAAATFIDIAKAFDSVNHTILLAKLEKAGIVGPALALITDNLSDRTFSVRIGDTTGAPEMMLRGVPQGSILSLILFLVYVNDLLKLKLKGTLQLYADDAAILFEGVDPPGLQDAMTDDLTRVFDWFCANGLAMNVKKTRHMIFCHPRKNFDRSAIRLRINGTEFGFLRNYNKQSLSI